MRRAALGAGLAFVVGVLLIAGGARLERGVPDWVLAGPLAVACAGVVVRRRAPVGSLGLGVVAVGLDAVVGPSLGTVLVFTDNLYAAALYGPARLARGLLMATAVLAVAGGAGAGFWAADWRRPAVIGVQAALVLVTPVMTALVVREQRDRAGAERLRAEQVARLAELDRRAAISAERTRMARELHDMIANHFSAIAIQSTAALSRADLDPGTVRKVMESVRENSVKGMAEMRAMIGLLRQEDGEPDQGDGGPGQGDGGFRGEVGEGEATRPRLADVETLVERVTAAGMEAGLRVEGVAREVPAAVDLAGYRIVQEALTNALKHGRSPVEVVVAYEPDRVVLRVWNALGGKRTGLPGAGAGLVGMRERAALVGGDVQAGEDAERGGWRVVAALPTEDERADTSPGGPGGPGGLGGFSSQVVGLMFPRETGS
ncbi:histidine kinase [Actinomadura sp. ATCC 31491]|uniref:histidine kinase n=1 Tax=Actinomadura luzonensis TaxID=2805427 RepID=A0ABT0FQ08_9ACTN|nr:histidine kinase [Actinomadura luzonensis]MCK2214436.1 histidine kinase [Actinomadura luzonensis]